MGYFKRALRKVQRPFKRMKGYIKFFKQKDMYKLLDHNKIRRWSDEVLQEGEKKVKRRIKIIEKFEFGPMMLIVIISGIILSGSIIIMNPQLYWVKKIMVITTLVVYFSLVIVILIANRKAKNILEKNSITINNEKARRIIKNGEYKKIKSIDSPKLCAILLQITDPTIDEVRSEQGEYYNIYVNGRRYRLEQEYKLEEKIEITD